MSVDADQQPRGTGQDAKHPDDPHPADVESRRPREGCEREDIEEFARIKLQLSPYRALRHVRCDVSDGVLTLSGLVPTYHYKQLAQTAVSDIAGVREIINSIDVK